MYVSVFQYWVAITHSIAIGHEGCYLSKATLVSRFCLMAVLPRALLHGTSGNKPNPLALCPESAPTSTLQNIFISAGRWIHLSGQVLLSSSARVIYVGNRRLARERPVWCVSFVFILSGILSGHIICPVLLPVETCGKCDANELQSRVQWFICALPAIQTRVPRSSCILPLICLVAKVNEDWKL